MEPDTPTEVRVTPAMGRGQSVERDTGLGQPPPSSRTTQTHRQTDTHTHTQEKGLCVVEVPGVLE